DEHAACEYCDQPCLHAPTLSARSAGTKNAGPSPETGPSGFVPRLLQPGRFDRLPSIRELRHARHGQVFLIQDLPDLPNLHLASRTRRASRPSDPKPNDRSSVIALQELMRSGTRIRESLLKVLEEFDHLVPA